MGHSQATVKDATPQDAGDPSQGSLRPHSRERGGLGPGGRLPGPVGLGSPRGAASELSTTLVHRTACSRDPAAGNPHLSLGYPGFAFLVMTRE